MTPALRIGLVGCGRIAERGYVPALGRAAGLELVAVADVDPARCAEAAPGIPAFGSVAALVGGARPEAVVVATPPATHLALARVVAEAGLPALVEKPPAADAAEAAELAALDPAPWIGFNRRFEPGLSGLRKRVPPAGALELVLEYAYRRADWDARVSSGDVLLDVGPHLVDLARWLTGSEIVDVHAGRIEAGEAELELALARGRARIACDGGRPYRERVEVRDEHGRLIGRHVVGGPGRALLSRLRSRGEHPLVPSLARQLEAFASAVSGAPAGQLATAVDGLKAMEAIDAARRS